MNIKKIVSNGLVIAVIIALLAFIPNAGERVLSWFFPPRLYVVLAVIVIVVLLKILHELRNRNDNE